MRITLRRALERTARPWRGALLGLDFDGTLAPLARRPELARLPKATKRLLARLARTPGVRLAILSGRALPDLRKQVGLPGVFYSGNHGLEIRGPGLAWKHPAAVRCSPRLRFLLRSLSPRMKAFPGAFIEDKGLTLAVHTRQMKTGGGVALRKLLKRELAASGGDWLLAEGKKTWEIRPRADWNKGLALLKIAGSRGGGPPVIFIGDDRTDEEGFRSLGPRALTIKVGGTGGTHARYRLSGPASIAAFLEELLELSVRTGKGPRSCRPFPSPASA